MTQIEIKAWELIGQMTPVQQYQLAVKILMQFEAVDGKSVFADKEDKSSGWKVDEHDGTHLVLLRKKQ